MKVSSMWSAGFQRENHPLLDILKPRYKTPTRELIQRPTGFHQIHVRLCSFTFWFFLENVYTTMKFKVANKTSNFSSFAMVLTYFMCCPSVKSCFNMQLWITNSFWRQFSLVAKPSSSLPQGTSEPQTKTTADASRGKNKFFLAKWFGFGSKWRQVSVFYW